MKYYKDEEINKKNIKNDNFYVVIDFDRTITSFDGDDSWDAAVKLLSKEMNKKKLELYQKYRPIELNYKISYKEKSEDMEEWYKECITLFKEYNLTKELLEESVRKSNLILKKGAKEFLEDMYKRNIPIIILSAGIGNVIEEYLKNKGCYFKNIYIISNFIEFDKDGKMKSFKNSMIHSLNKTIEGNLPKVIEESVNKKEWCLLLGDALEDIKMVTKRDKTLAVGFLKNETKENLELYKEQFDIVLTKEDANFISIKDIIN